MLAVHWRVKCCVEVVSTAQVPFDPFSFPHRKPHRFLCLIFVSFHYSTDPVLQNSLSQTALQYAGSRTITTLDEDLPLVRRFFAGHHLLLYAVEVRFLKGQRTLSYYSLFLSVLI